MELHLVTASPKQLIYFSEIPKTGTFMHSSKIGYRDWLFAFYLLSTNLKGVSSMKLHRDLGVTQKTAWHLAHRVRKALQSGGFQFSAPVEVDETYIGGKRKNMSNARRQELEGTGRGAVGKTAVVGAKDRATKHVAAKVVGFTDKETLQGFVQDWADLQATVYTDEAGAYETLPFDHETVKHSVGEYVRGKAHTNGVESFWSMLKRGYIGTYHHMSPQHLQRYVDEFSGRPQRPRAEHAPADGRDCRIRGQHPAALQGLGGVSCGQSPGEAVAAVPGRACTGRHEMALANWERQTIWTGTTAPSCAGCTASRRT